MAVKIDIVEELLKQAFPDAEIVVRDTRSNGDYYEVSVTSSMFEGLNVVKQHKLVYQALGNKVGNDIHAFSLKTKVK